MVIASPIPFLFFMLESSVTTWCGRLILIMSSYTNYVTLFALLIKNAFEQMMHLELSPFLSPI